MDDTHQIFVSYSRKDENAVLPVVQELKSRGLSLWLDQEEVHGGPWRRRIAAGLESSRAMLFMVSRESLKSSRTLSEASMADDHGLPIIPVLLEDVKIAGEWNLILARFHHIFAQGRQRDLVIADVVKAVEQLGMAGPTAATGVEPRKLPEPRSEPLSPPEPVDSGEVSEAVVSVEANLERFRNSGVVAELMATAGGLDRALTSREIRAELEHLDLLPINFPLVESIVERTWSRHCRAAVDQVFSEAHLAIGAGRLDNAEVLVQRLFELDPHGALDMKTELVGLLGEAQRNAPASSQSTPSPIERELKDVEQLMRRSRVLEAYRELSLLALDPEKAPHVADALAPIERAVLVAQEKARQILPAAQVLIPAGWYRSSFGDWEFMPPYAIDVRPVTCSDYVRFLENTGGKYRRHRLEPQFQDHTPSGWTGGSSEGSLSVTGVSWFDAMAYARWAKMSLPTDNEWEKAALWDDGARQLRPYPWGSSFDATLSLTCDSAQDGPQAVPASPDIASPYGLRAAYGNVWEWCVDGYDRSFAGGIGALDAPDVWDAHVLRGGSWKETAQELGDVWRSRAYPQSKVEDAGFRCAREVKLSFK